MMPQATAGKIRIGIGGWTFEPWRGSFYPDKHPHKQELEYASRQMTSIEVNGTYYGAQKAETFAKWHAQTPDDFVFSLKAPRYATNRKVLAEAGATIERFFASGVTELKDKLGPINWQFMATKKFDPSDFHAFLELLPASVDGRELRHVVEVRHDSFRSSEFVAMTRERGVAIAVAGDSDHPQIADPTASFVYARIMGTQENEDRGYSSADLGRWAETAEAWASGKTTQGLHYVTASNAESLPRDVYLYVIGGGKVRNPAAASALIELLR